MSAVSRQRQHQKRKREVGDCAQCGAKAMATGQHCLRCHVKRALKRNHLWSYIALNKRRTTVLLAALEGRFATVLATEGFAINALGSVEDFIERNAGDWAKSGKARAKLARIVNGLDDRAIRYRMRAMAQESEH